MHNIVHYGTVAFLNIAPRRTCLTNWFQWYLGKVYYRFWCPGGDGRVRDCIAKGDCGCDNGPAAVRVRDE